MEKQNIKVGIGGQLAATVAAYGHQRAAILVLALTKRDRRSISAFHHHVQHSSTRRRRLSSRRPAAVSHLQTLILNLKEGSELSTYLRRICGRLVHREPRCGVHQHLLAMGSLARSG